MLNFQWRQKYLKQNLTCTVCISRHGCEQVQFLDNGGQKHQTYINYFSHLVEKMQSKYPNQTLVFQHDNLLAHKNADIMKIVQGDRLEMIFSPSHTPEFSSVENVFADLKRQLSSYQYINVKETADKILKILFNYKSLDIKVFFKQVFRNILDFWDDIKVRKCL